METDAVINPTAGKKTPALGPVAVISATRADLDNILNTLNIDKKNKKSILIADLWVSDDGLISVSGPFTGAPHAAMVIENLIVCGVEKIIFSGWCGAVSPDVKTGDIIIPDSAFSDEGTSKHYIDIDASEPLKTSTSISGVLKKRLISNGIQFHEGSIWTTDAIYRETKSKIEYYQSKDVLGVEMELSALIAVSRFREVEIASVQIVSDEVSSFNWKPGFGNKKFKKSRRIAAEIIAEACLEIVNNDR